MSEGDDIVIQDVDCLSVHDVVAESFLELGRHEVISWPRTRQDGKVDLEPEEVEEEWHHQKTDSTGDEMLAPSDHVQGPFSPIDVE